MQRKTLTRAIRLCELIESRLNALAETTGRTKTTLAREAILEFIEDLEDFYLAEARAHKNRKAIATSARHWRAASSAITGNTA